MQKRLQFIITLILLISAPRLVGAWGQEAHRFITARVIERLPVSIRPFYQKHRNFIVEHSVDPDLWRNVGFAEEPPRHFLDCDAYGAYPFPDLPHDFDAAVKKYGHEMIMKNGLLPWRTAEIYDRLVQAFDKQKKGNGPYVLEDILYFSAVLAHYIGDAHVPFHATSNYDGQLTNQVGIHSRFETELFFRYRAKLKIIAGALVRVDNVRDFSFATLFESFTQVEPLLKADLAAVAGRQDYDDIYFGKFALQGRPILEHRINDSILHIASIIASAWEKGGKPELPLNPPVTIRKVRNNHNFN
jgi:hypothetical protein